MNTRLGNLYRRYTRGSAAPLPSADALVAIVDGERSADAQRVLADVTRSSVNADLLRFARALAPESARLGVQLEQALEIRPSVHRRDPRWPARQAAGRREFARVAAALAACLLVAVTVFSLQQRAPDATGSASSAATAPAARQDRIFAAYDNAGPPRHGDEIFNASFRDDRIFNAKFSGG